MDLSEKLKAKDMSLIGQILAVLCIVGFHIYEMIKGVSFTTGDICKAGICIMLCFCPVYVNMLIDKFVK